MNGIGVELLGVIAVGVGMAALLYAGMHLSRKLGLVLPRWILPAGIGLAMIGYAVWNDYAWLGRTTDRLPEGAQILMVGTDRQPWAPWTYLRPVPVRLAAMDGRAATTTDDGTRRAQIMLVERRRPTLVLSQDFDCKGRRVRAPRSGWQPVAEGDPAFAAICSGAAAAVQRRD